MKRLKKFVALLLLALWMPATSHPFLETAGVIHQDATEKSSNADHDAADGKCFFKSSGFKVEKAAQTNPPLPLAFLNDEWTVATREIVPSHATVDFPGPAPPHLRKIWQFVSRAALPVRAPSLAS